MGPGPRPPARGASFGALFYITKGNAKAGGIFLGGAAAGASGTAIKNSRRNGYKKLRGPGAIPGLLRNAK